MNTTFEMRSSRVAFRNLLLPATIRHASARIPGYRALYGQLAERVNTVEDLPLLPMTSKETMMAALESFRDPSVPTAVIQHTGGTSRRTLVIHRGQPELQFIHDFFCKVQAPEPGAPGLAPLCISVIGNFHGDPTPVPYPAPVFTLNLNDPYWDIKALVTDPGAVLGISDRREAVLVGLESQVRILSCRLIEAGYDFKQSAVTAIHTTGDLITGRLRRFYEGLWRVPLINRYSMTEVFGGANPCTECGHFHFDPHVVAEVVDPFTREPVTKGHGIPIVTCLYPFVQKQPFIRYYTGDLVRIATVDCPVDALGFDLEGRAASCVLDQTPSGTQPLLASAVVYDVIDDYPEVASSQMFRALGGITDHSALGHLKFKISRTDRDQHVSLTLTVETRFTSYMHPERTKSLCAEIRDRIVREHPRLSQRLAEGSADFEVTTALPGTLNSFMPDETE